MPASLFFVSAIAMVAFVAGNDCGGEPTYIDYCLSSCGDEKFTVTQSWTATYNGKTCQNCTTTATSIQPTYDTIPYDGEASSRITQPESTYYCSRTVCKDCSAQCGGTASEEDGGNESEAEGGNGSEGENGSEDEEDDESEGGN